MEPVFAMFPTIGAIAVICFLIGEGLKLTSMPTKAVPEIVAIAGAILGVIGHSCGILELASLNILDAMATGIVSGLVASGGYSLAKNVTGAYPENDLSKADQREIHG